MRENKTKTIWSFFCLFIAALAIIIGFSIPSQISVSNTTNGRELPIYCVETNDKKVSISFDAAWGNEQTNSILEILKNHKVHATFFATGGWVEKYPEDVKAILAEGHDLGNHSENHKNMSQLSDEECKTEIQSVHEKVKELTGYEMNLFRAPYGDYDNEMLKMVQTCGYQCIQWDVDSLDWKDYGVDDIVERVCDSQSLTNGSIILCHNGGKYTVDALNEVLTRLEEMGYQIVPVSELIYKENYYMNNEGRQCKDK